MALPAVIDKAAYEKLPDTLKAEYQLKEDGDFKGQYFLDVVKADVKSEDGKKSATFAVEDVSGLKSALQKERSNAEDATAKLKAFEGIDADKARDALKRIDELGDGSDANLKHQQALKAQKESLETKFSQDLKAVTDQAERYKIEVSRVLVDQEILSALSQHKLVDGGSSVLLPGIKSAIKVVEQDGKFVAKVVDENGNPRISMQQGNTGDMSVGEFVSTFKDKPGYKNLFAGSGANGSDTQGGTPNNTQRLPQPTDGRTPEQRGIHRVAGGGASALVAARAAQMSNNSGNNAGT